MNVMKHLGHDGERPGWVWVASRTVRQQLSLLCGNAYELNWRGMSESWNHSLFGVVTAWNVTPKLIDFLPRTAFEPVAALEDLEIARAWLGVCVIVNWGVAQCRRNVGVDVWSWVSVSERERAVWRRGVAGASLANTRLERSKYLDLVSLPFARDFQAVSRKDRHHPPRKSHTCRAWSGPVVEAFSQWQRWASRKPWLKFIGRKVEKVKRRGRPKL